MRKLLMLAVTALAALALAGVSATAASAVPFEVYDSGSFERCDDVFGGVSESGGVVQGGCLVDDFGGRFDVYVGTTPVNYYDAGFDLVLGTDGAGYAVNAAIYSQGWGFVRQTCTHPVSGQPEPWPVQVSALGGGVFQAEMTMCITDPNYPTSGTYQTVTLDIAESGYEDGRTELVQAEDASNIRNSHWSSDNTFELVEIEE